MDREAALEILGLTSASSTIDSNLREAYETKLRYLTDRSHSASSDAERSQCELLLAQLSLAYKTAKASLGGSLGGAAGSSDPIVVSDRLFAEQGSMLASRSDGKLEIGQVLAKRFVISGQILESESGAIFEASTRDGTAKLAIKVIPNKLVELAGGFERFSEQAQIVAGLSHKNIVKVNEFQRDGSLHFFTFQLLQGESLRSVMERRKAARKPFTIDSIAEIRRGLCEALIYLHQSAFHLDIKPENIWVDVDGTVKLMDFGLGRLLSSPPGPTEYMSPERIEDPQNVTEQADQYSLAAVLFEMLTGRTPTGPGEESRRIRSDIPIFVSKALARATARRPQDRYKDVSAFNRAVTISSKITNNVIKSAAAVAAILVLGIIVSNWWGTIANQPWLNETLFERQYHQSIKAGKSLLQQGKPLEAEQKFNDALGKKSDSQEAAELLKDAQRQQRIQEGKNALNAKKYADAENKFASALQDKAGDPEVEGLLNESRFRIAMEDGDRHAKNKDYDSAAKSYKKAEELNPNDRDASDKLQETRFKKYVNAGDLSYAAKNYQQAHSDFAEALKIREKDKDVTQKFLKVQSEWFDQLVKGANEHLAAKRWKECLDLLAKAQQLRPDSLKIKHTAAGVRALMDGKYDVAATELEKAQKATDPK